MQLEAGPSGGGNAQTVDPQALVGPTQDQHHAHHNSATEKFQDGCPLMRVLVATADRTFTPSLVQAYREFGWQVFTGVDNLFYRSAAYDLVHLHWPEELVDWRFPTSEALQRLKDALSWFAGRTSIIATVHNLVPHRAKEHPLDRELYRLVYRTSHVIGHFSEYSKTCVQAFFPETATYNHIVHPPYLPTHLLEHGQDREKARQGLGLGSGDFAVLAFGSLRTSAEVLLLLKGFTHSRVRGKRMIFAAQLLGANRLQRVTQRLRLEIWRRFHRVIWLEGFQHDCEVPSLLHAADAVVIPRFGPHLNSGMLSLAMLFGTPIVAPRYGPYPEYLAGTLNQLYKPSDPWDLCKAIDSISGFERIQIFRQNREIAAQWGWSKALNLYLSLLPMQPRKSLLAI
jgi:glycosyltransferase involved in cell wall biosynthesis